MHSRNEKFELILDKISGLLILITVLALPFETWETAPALVIVLIEWWELGVTLVFLVEYCLRIWLAEKRLRYIFSFYGILDAVTIFPYFIAPWMALQELRVFRLLRLLRLVKGARYSRALRSFSRALAERQGEAVVFLSATGITLYVASLGIYHFEHEAQPEAFSNVFDALWWAVATLTTVGYGDVYPITTGGKIFTAFIAFLSLGIVATLAGLVASALTKVAMDDDSED